MADHIDIVFKGSGPAIEFVEIEVGGKSMRIGKPIQRDDGFWALRVTKEEIDALPPDA